MSHAEQAPIRGNRPMQRLSILLYPDEVQALIDAAESVREPPAVLRVAHEQLCYARQRGEATGR